MLAGETTYTWMHPDPDVRSYELRDANSKPLMTLAWTKEHGTTARASADSNVWTFKRTGFLTPVLTIREGGSAEEDVARFELQVGGGGVLRVEHLDVEWKPNLWRAQWKWKTLGGSDLLIYKRNFTAGDREGEMKVTKEAAGFRQTTLLALFGWYMVILIAEESSLAAG